MSWPEVKLSDIIEYIRGVTFKPSQKMEPYSEGSVVCFTTANVQDELDITKLTGIEETVVKNDDRFIRPGDLLISSANSWNLVGKTICVPDLDYKATAGGFIGIIRPINIDSRYLYYWITSDESQLKIRHLGRQTTNISNLSIPRFLNMKIPLPPMEEQKRIVAILDKAKEINHESAKARILRKDAINSLFYDMFGDPVANPMDWKLQILGEICGVGSSKRVFKTELVEEGIPFYRGTEIGKLGNGETITPGLFITNQHYDALKGNSGVPKIGDLLMPSICPDGRIFTVINDSPFYFKDGRVLWIKVDQTIINSTFLRYLLKAIFNSNYENIASGSTFAELKIFALKKMILPVPPIELQKEFAGTLELIQKILTTEDLSSILSNSIKQELLT